MSFDSPFVLPADEYRRDLNILEHYEKDVVQYLCLMTGASVEQAQQYVRKNLQKGGRFPFKDPRILYTERGENGDRELKSEITLHRYLQEAIAREQLIAPSLTIYKNPRQSKSLLVDFIDDNIKARKKAKLAMFKAEKAGDKLKQSIYDKEQTNRKLSNNSLSGAHSSDGNPFFNKTAHITLTSTCRSTSGYGNANNEKLLAGNRHYWSPKIVLNNIISIINHTDYATLEQAMQTYGLKYPTVDDTLACIRYSTKLYWENRDAWRSITELIEKLTPLQRAAFVYTGDFYQVKVLNDAFTREMLGNLARHMDTPHPDPDSVLDDADEAIVQTANQICEVEMRGKELKEIKGTPEYGIVAAVVENIIKQLDHYRLFIKAFWVTENMPASVAHFPQSIRRTALTSDTDSTIFTVQDWIEWYFGDLKVTPQTNGLAAVLIYFSSQTIIHLLARMSANMGIEKSLLFKIAMKNEYKFDVYVPTQVAKHYFALIGCQEGNLWKEYKKEIKGVHLKSSNAPVFVMKEAEKLMLSIMHTVLRGEKIKIIPILKRIAEIEHGVVEAVSKGDPKYLRKNQIKAANSYTKEKEQSPYLQYLLWQEVFAPDYGEAAEPPYVAYKLAVDLKSPTKVREWCDSLENQALAERFKRFMVKYGKTNIGTIMVPEQIVISKGLPKELYEVAQLRGIVRDTTKVFYLILEALNIFVADPKNNRLLMDYY